MKKEEAYKRNNTLKNECDFRSRSLSPKAYLGCSTCRLKKVKSNDKLNDCNFAQQNYKRKKSFLKKDDGKLKNHKIKLTDLCDEDKGRVVELIEELAKFEEKNQQLKLKLDEVQKEKQEQRNHMIKQTNLFLEEKHFFVDEINKYKSRLEAFESEMSNKMSSWENSRRLKDNKIIYFAKALEKSLKEKNELHELMNRLKACLKNSLESFQKLKAQVTELQSQEQGEIIRKSICCQTENKASAPREKNDLTDAETEEEEFFSAGNHDKTNAKNSLEIINDKIEYVYQILRKEKEKSPQKYEIDLSILLKNDILTKGDEMEELNKRNEDDQKVLKAGNEKAEEMFLKPHKKCSKTLVEVENVLKNTGHPINLIVNECTQMLENNKLDISTPKESSKDLVRCSNFLQSKIIQKNNLFKLPEDDQYQEDRILEELFYSDQNLTLGLESILRLETKELEKYYKDGPFT